MRGWLSTACWTLFGAAVGAATESLALTLALWTVVVVLGLVQLVGPVADLLGESSATGWRRRMLTLVIGGLCAVVGFVGSELSLTRWEGEKRAEAERRQELNNLRDQVKNANQRAAALEEVQRQRLDKYQVVNNHLTEQMRQGGELRYRVEDAINNAMKAPETFMAWDQQEFDKLYTADIEKWRAETERALNADLPGRGQAFKDILGEYGHGKSGFRLTQIRECLSFLRATQQGLRSDVELLVR